MFTTRGNEEIPAGLQHILSSVLNLPKLTTVKLNENAFGIRTYKPLVEFLASHVPLQHLHLSDNGLGPECSTYVAQALEALHGKKEEARKDDPNVPHLETIICNDNRLELNGTSMAAWAKTLNKYDKLKVLKLVHNDITKEGSLILLEDGIRNHSTLQVLDLNDNKTDSKAGEVLIEALSTWTDMRELGIGDNLLKPEDITALTEELAKGEHKNLEVLNIQGCDIDADGLEEILEVVKSSLPALRKMDLEWNDVEKDDEPVIALDELFQERKRKFKGKTVDADWGVAGIEDLEEDRKERAEERGMEEVKEEEEDKDIADLTSKLEKATVE
jgi:Ran GTPase-activating protein 1